MIVDSGLLVALERDDREAWALLAVARVTAPRPVAPAGVLARAWCGGVRQARLAMALRAIDVDVMDRETARQVGVLLGRTGGRDVIDGHVALLAGRRPDLDVVTADRGRSGTPRRPGRPSPRRLTSSQSSARS